ncbi:MAG: single-stranded-DNA-specific exonuclease RecJ [Candidatus Margulisiibacteriota bacterium]
MKKWLLHKVPPAEVERLSTALKVSPLVASILVNRGLGDLARAELFLNPKLAQLRDPFEIPNIKTGAERVLLAKERGEKVLIYGDYDVDGVTGTAILVHTCKFLGLDVAHYIPHRYGEGYSLSLESVRKIEALGVKLIVTVDCGIASAKEVAEANRLGMAVVVTDHHNLPQELPPAVAVVNPKMISGEHPSKYLAGAGVAFKFAWALLKTAGVRDAVFLTSLLDLAALGTLADVVPLTDENRILAVGGLSLINERKRVGLKSLAEAASLRDKITVNNVYFALSPRLNAAGRLEHASHSLELLLTDDPEQAKKLAQGLNRINIRRQDIGVGIKEEVFAQLSAAYVAEHKLIVLSGQNWHPGVIGIIASQVVDAYSRPTVLIGINEGVGRGSARSVDGVNIFALLDSCRDLFLDFGGHEGAAGFSIAADNIPELKRRLKIKVEELIGPEQLLPTVEIDAELSPSQVSLGLVRELSRLAPFGEDNAEPLLLLRGMRLTERKKVGKGGKHLKARFERDGVTLETIGFGFGEIADSLVFQQPYDLAVNLESNEYNGFESVQLSLNDLREEK